MNLPVVLNVSHFSGVKPLVPEDRFRRGNPLLRMWQSVKRQIVDDVPDALAICQFDCDRAECTRDGLGACERLNGKSAGELFRALPLGTPAQFRFFGA
jgi:hypothetical protein